MYSEVQYFVKLKSGLTDPFISKVGDKQGCVLSPLLLKFLVDDLSKFFKKQKRAPIAFGDLYAYCLMDADGIVFFFRVKRRATKMSLLSLKLLCQMTQR